MIEKLRPYLLLASLILGLASWLISDHYPPWTSFYNEFTAFLALWFLLLYANSHPPQNPPLNYWPIYLALLALVPLTQYKFGIIYYSGDAILASSYIFGLAIASYTGYALTRSNASGFTTSLSYLLLCGSLVSVALALIQWLELDISGIWVTGSSPNRPGANFGQPNHLATALYLGLAATLYLKLTRQISTPTLLLLIPVLIFAIVLTQSRMAWFSLAFTVFWCLLKRKSLSSIEQKSVYIALGAIMATFIILITFWPTDVNLHFAEHTATSQRSDLFDPGSRPAIWEGLLLAIREQPYWGYGWNQVAVAHALSATLYPLPEMVTHGHNILLDLLIWNGVPIGLFIAVVTGFWFTSRARNSRTAESWFAILAIGLVGTHSMFEYPLEYAYFLLPAGLLAGLVDADQKISVRFTLSKKLIWAVAAIYGLALIGIWHEYSTAEDEYRQARFESRHIGVRKAADNTPNLILLTQLNADLIFMRTEITNSMNSETLARMQKTAYRYPFISNLLRYALAMAINNREDVAIREIYRLKDLYGEDAYLMALENLQILADSEHPSLHNFIRKLNQPQYNN